MNILTLLDGMSLEEIGKLIKADRDACIREKAQELLNELIENEICEFFEKAANATEGNFRNGYYSRTVNSTFGSLNLRVPRDRVNRFKTSLLSPYQRTTGTICELI